MTSTHEFFMLSGLARPKMIFAAEAEAQSPQPTKATKKLIDSSARNPLIYIGSAGAPSGLRPTLGGKGRRENAQTESNTCRLLSEMTRFEVRKNP
jgi:hypothetical protein